MPVLRFDYVTKTPITYQLGKWARLPAILRRNHRIFVNFTSLYATFSGFGAVYKLVSTRCICHALALKSCVTR